MKPSKCISVEEARGLQKDWKASRGEEIKKAQGYEDTCDFWYSVEELEEYLNYVKEKSKEQGINKPGIRIYFASYPKKENGKSYSTVFLAPTKEKNSAELAADNELFENNYNIEPLNTVTGGKPPKEY